MQASKSELTPFEQSELSRFQYIYTVGTVRVNSRNQIAKQGKYLVNPGEQIGYRYLVDTVLDSGAFGQVCKCRDMREGGKFVALKISSDRQQETMNA
jgi:hypothetical protein